MYISEILEITNYRNLTGKRIKFNETLNFLIGENNIGKTNMLELINIFLRRYKMLIPEYEWEVQLGGSHAMYYAIEDFLNDSILNDIEKLYRQ